ncbi:MAG: 6-bladed beta-propeller, partial [Bacteroidales bacterium]|nr:6-bladed beta-propeller [Bacteroidales bacterium]
VIGTIIKSIVTDKYIYIVDFYEGSTGLLQFEKNGKFVKRYIKGGGADEFNYILAISFSDNCLYVFDTQKLLKYSESGKFIGAKPYSDQNLASIAKDGVGFVTLQVAEQTEDHKFKIIKLDSNLVKKSELSLDPISSISNTGEICSDGNNGLIYRLFDNNIYGWSDNGFNVKYRLDFSDYEYQIQFEKYQNLPPEQRYQAFTMLMADIEKDRYVFFGSVHNSDDYLSFLLMSNGSSAPIFFNKNTGKTLIKKYGDNKSPLAQFSESGTVRGKKNTFFGSIIPEYIGDCWKYNPNNLFSAKDIEILKNAKEDDNPIIVIYKLKDNL